MSPQLARSTQPLVPATLPGPSNRRLGSATPAVRDAPSIVYEVAASAGTPLDTLSRSFAESHFGRDFSNVRVHSDSTAAASAAAVHADAYTVGQHIAFAAGRYAPQDPNGRKLLNHELVHVVQQSQLRGLSTPEGPIETGPPDDAFEQRAHLVANQLEGGDHPAGSMAALTLPAAAPLRLQRSPVDDTVSEDSVMREVCRVLDAKGIRFSTQVPVRILVPGQEPYERIMDVVYFDPVLGGWVLLEGKGPDPRPNTPGQKFGDKEAQEHPATQFVVLGQARTPPRSSKRADISFTIGKPQLVGSFQYVTGATDKASPTGVKINWMAIRVWREGMNMHPDAQRNPGDVTYSPPNEGSRPISKEEAADMVRAGQKKPAAAPGPLPLQPPNTRKPQETEPSVETPAAPGVTRVGPGKPNTLNAMRTGQVAAAAANRTTAPVQAPAPPAPPQPSAPAKPAAASDPKPTSKATPSSARGDQKPNRDTTEPPIRIAPEVRVPTDQPEPATQLRIHDGKLEAVDDIIEKDLAPAQASPSQRRAAAAPGQRPASTAVNPAPQASPPKPSTPSMPPPTAPAPGARVATATTSTATKPTVAAPTPVGPPRGAPPKPTVSSPGAASKADVPHDVSSSSEQGAKNALRAQAVAGLAAVAAEYMTGEAERKSAGDARYAALSDFSRVQQTILDDMWTKPGGRQLAFIFNLLTPESGSPRSVQYIALSVVGLNDQTSIQAAMSSAHDERESAAQFRHNRDQDIPGVIVKEFHFNVSLENPFRAHHDEMATDKAKATDAAAITITSVDHFKSFASGDPAAYDLKAYEALNRSTSTFAGHLATFEGHKLVIPHSIHERLLPYFDDKLRRRLTTALDQLFARLEFLKKKLKTRLDQWWTTKMLNRTGDIPLREDMFHQSEADLTAARWACQHGAYRDAQASLNKAEASIDINDSWLIRYDTGHSAPGDWQNP